MFYQLSGKVHLSWYTTSTILPHFHNSPRKLHLPSSSVLCFTLKWQQKKVTEITFIECGCSLPVHHQLPESTQTHIHRDGWMASPIQWSWVWASSGRWWRTGKPGVLQSVGSQRVRHDWVTEEQQWTLSAWSLGQRVQIIFKALEPYC